MNVAVFASAFYPHTGGVEELVRQFSHEFAVQGGKPLIVTNRWPRSLSRRESYEDIPVLRLAMRVPDWSLRVRFQHVVTFPFTRWRMLEELRRHRTELIHVQCISSNGYYALSAARALRVPLVVTAQGERTMDAGKLYEQSQFSNRLLRELLVDACFVTACSRHTLDDLQEWLGQPFGCRAKVVYNGIRLEDFSETAAHRASRPYVLGIGRLVPQKGFDVLIDGFAKARIDSHDLVLAGEGPERVSLEARARTLGLAERIHFIGRVDRTTAVALFKGAAFFVLPSLMEPMGIVNLEAMAAGKAVIASRTGGVPEIVLDGDTGLLVPPGDSEELAKAIARLATNEGLRVALGRAGKERVTQFSWTRCTEQYRAIYDQVRAGHLREKVFTAAAGRCGLFETAWRRRS